MSMINLNIRNHRRPSRSDRRQVKPLAQCRSPDLLPNESNKERKFFCLSIFSGKLLKSLDLGGKGILTEKQQKGLSEANLDSVL